MDGEKGRTRAASEDKPNDKGPRDRTTKRNEDEGAMTNEGAKREIEAEWERMNDDEE